MAERSAIAWTDHSFAPWHGCTKVSTGPLGACVGCYAENIDVTRFKKVEGFGNFPRVRAPDSTWKQPRAWDRKAAPAVAGPGGTGLCVADPRGSENRHVNGKYRVTPYDGPANSVIAASTTGNGASVVADPRVDGRRNGALGVLPFDEPSGVVAGESLPPNGTFAVADPREVGRHHGVDGVTPWDEPSGVVQASSRPSNGTFAVADPRLEDRPRFSQVLHVTAPDETAPAVTSAKGSLAAVADPRPAGLQQPDHYGVLEWQEHSGTVTASSHGWDNGRFSVADPRPAGLQGKDQNSYGNQGHYGVIGWEDHSWSVTAHGQADNAKWSVADRRIDLLPGLAEQLVCIIIARDNTWHRPFTTLELAALQSLYDPEDALELDGRSDSAWRERIGNAVPSAAAQAIASVMGTTLLLAMTGESFTLSNESIWVRQLQIGLSVDVSGQVPEAIGVAQL